MADGDMFGDIGRTTVQMQQEGLKATQQWSESVMGLLEDQAEQTTALMRALRSSLEAMEQALQSQEQTNRALRETLESYRQVVDRASGTQRQTAELVRSSLAGVMAVQQQQLEAARALLSSTSVPRESLAGLMDQWLGAYRTMFETFMPRTGRSDEG